MKNWARSFTIEQDGFHGHLYLPAKTQPTGTPPENPTGISPENPTGSENARSHPITHPENPYRGKALLVLGGGGMPYRLTMQEAAAFANMGITALAVGYFGVRGAPKTIVRVPIEYVERAAQFLHSAGYPKVTAVGISKGAELALAAASATPEVNGVIAFSPSDRAYMGVGPGISWVNASSWTYRGAELPYAYAPASGWRALMNSLKSRELTFRPIYEKAARNSGPETLIPVQNIAGPILLCASTTDSLWPSEQACRTITERLDASGFVYPHKQLIYRYASHILLPFETGYEKFFRVGRENPRKCRETIQELNREVREWLKG